MHQFQERVWAGGVEREIDRSRLFWDNQWNDRGQEMPEFHLLTKDHRCIHRIYRGSMGMRYTMQSTVDYHSNFAAVMAPGDRVKSMVGKLTNEFLLDYCRELKMVEPPRKSNQSDVLILTEQGHLIQCHMHSQAAPILLKFPQAKTLI